MPLKAVLFDMDGVIVDTEPLHKKAYFRTFEDLGIDVSEELYSTFTGNSTQKVCETLVTHFQLNISWEEIAKIKRNYFKYLFDNDPDFDLIPGVKNLIIHYFNALSKIAVKLLSEGLGAFALIMLPCLSIIINLGMPLIR